eukprot:tig00020710_g13263.t1
MAFATCPLGAAAVASTHRVELAIESSTSSREASRASSAFEGVTHVLSTIAPDGEGDVVVDMHGKDIRGCERLVWCGYLSSTGVYGQQDGKVVFEDSPLNPSSERARRRARAEQAWRDLGIGSRLHIFRLAGIYGPERNTLEKLRSGRTPAGALGARRPGQVFSRIHVADICQVIQATFPEPEGPFPSQVQGAQQQEGEPFVWNVSDDEPCEPGVVIDYARSLLGMKPAAQEDPSSSSSVESGQLSETILSFYGENKRPSNRRITRELGVRLRYPTYREGLSAIAAGDTAPF